MRIALVQISQTHGPPLWDACDETESVECFDGEPDCDVGQHDADEAMQSTKARSIFSTANGKRVNCASDDTTHGHDHHHLLGKTLSAPEFGRCTRMWMSSRSSIRLLAA